MSESHDIVAEALGQLFEEIKLLMEKKSIVVERMTYCLEIILGGDLKVRRLDTRFYCTTVITLLCIYINSFC